MSVLIKSDELVKVPDIIRCASERDVGYISKLRLDIVGTLSPVSIEHRVSDRFRHIVKISLILF